MRSIVGILAFAAALAATTSALAENILIARSALTEYSQHDATLGKVFTMPLTAPSAATRSTCGHVMLELFMDVSAKDRDGYVNEGPVVEVYALTGGNTSFTKQALDKAIVARRPIAAGQARRVVLDITNIAKPLVSGEKQSITLVIGSLSGKEEGDFRLRTDILPDGAVARVYFDELSPAEQPRTQK